MRVPLWLCALVPLHLTRGPHGFGCNTFQPVHLHRCGRRTLFTQQNATQPRRRNRRHSINFLGHVSPLYYCCRPAPMRGRCLTVLRCNDRHQLCEPHLELHWQFRLLQVKLIVLVHGRQLHHCESHARLRTQQHCNPSLTKSPI